MSQSPAKFKTVAKQERTGSRDASMALGPWHLLFGKASCFACFLGSTWIKHFLPYMGSWIRAEASSFLEAIVDLIQLPNSQNHWAHYLLPVLSEEITVSTIPFESLPYALSLCFSSQKSLLFFFLLLQLLFLLPFTVLLLFSPLCPCPPPLPLDAWKTNQ